ncbi:arginine/serine-rich coiled-coil protein 2 isoform X4 [Syngnathus scovelli]|uniref:arginine/serine-rich coiled-coil protein 2 isoform X4 n=1 Tax=Syngnathus scovelli TaxID=161590 RepID=UPI002110B057|nr:arginine/serine-rich coiled-coil protein 2 isoform X4 [Syngnathus scovelli]XP_049618130.1 arginine/serine-rich coiled-coil protein 2 isoform X4 [Syngnathus scovelli]
MSTPGTETHFFLKQARKREPEKPSKSHKQADEHHERLSAEDGDKRSRRKDKRSSRGRSSSRSHSRERRHHSRSRDRRRSSRSHSRDRKRRPRSRSRSRSKHRNRSGSRSRSRCEADDHFCKRVRHDPMDNCAHAREQRKKSEKVRKRSRSGSANPPIFRGRNTAMDAQEALARRLERAKKLQEQKELSEKHQQEVIGATSPVAIAATPTTTVSAVAAASNHALNVAALLASGTQVTPQIAMAAQMAALQARALAETGVAVPSYYNPSAVNPCKFADQEKKRKKLWQGKKDGDKSQTAELWENLNFGNKDQNVKFRKLMGIKADEEGEASRPLNDEGLKTLQKQEEVFRNLDVQYEMARSQTHTQRGMGLGFSSAFSRGMDSF